MLAPFKCVLLKYKTLVVKISKKIYGMLVEKPIIWVYVIVILFWD